MRTQAQWTDVQQPLTKTVLVHHTCILVLVSQEGVRKALAYWLFCSMVDLEEDEIPAVQLKSWLFGFPFYFQLDTKAKICFFLIFIWQDFALYTCIACIFWGASAWQIRNSAQIGVKIIWSCRALQHHCWTGQSRGVFLMRGKYVVWRRPRPVLKIFSDERFFSCRRKLQLKTGRSSHSSFPRRKPEPVSTEPSDDVSVLSKIDMPNFWFDCLPLCDDRVTRGWKSYREQKYSSINSRCKTPNSMKPPGVQILRLPSVV